MKRFALTLAILVLVLATATAAFAQGGAAKVRVVHASPDAPAVDVLVNGTAAFTNAPFTGITDYAELDAGSYNVQVVPTGETEPVVIDADVTLDAGTNYSVVAVGTLENIEPLVLVDDSSAPAEGMAHVRFVHASPDAPAVDIAVADGGPVIFENVAFKGSAGYTPVDAGTYDLEARLAGTDTVALSVPGVSLEAGKAYTVFAMGLVDGEPALQAVLAEDALAQEMAPETMPETGGSQPFNSTLILVVLGAMALAAGVFARSRVLQS